MLTISRWELFTAAAINPKAGGATSKRASGAGIRKASTDALPNLRYLISSLIAGVAFISIVSWTEIGTMGKSKTDGPTSLSSEALAKEGSRPAEKESAFVGATGAKDETGRGGGRLRSNY
jgi:hypothetical protein